MSSQNEAPRLHEEQKGRTIGFQAGLVILIPFLLGAFLILRAEAERLEGYQSAAQISDISERTAELLNAQTQLQNEWQLSIDTASISTLDFATLSDEVDRRIGESLEYQNRSLVEESIRSTDQALAQVDLESLPAGAQTRLGRLDELRRRLPNEQITPVELDLFYSRLIDDIDGTLQRDLDRLEPRAGLQIQIDLNRQQHLTDTISKASLVQQQLTYVVQDLLRVEQPDWDELEHRAIEATLVNESLERFEARYKRDQEASNSPNQVAPETDFSAIESLANDARTTDDPGALIGEALQLREQTVLDTQDLVDRLQVTADEIAAKGQTIRDEARQTLIESAVLFVLSTVLLLAAIRYLVRSIGLPLRRAATTAAKVSQGDLDVEVSNTEGPREVRLLSSALAELVETVSVIERQAVAMSEGKLDSPALSERLPGKLGRSLESSIGRWRDISQQVQASNRITSAINESTSDAQLLCDANLVITQANPAAALLFGMPANQMVGCGLPDLASMPLLSTLTEIGDNGTLTDQATIHSRSGPIKTVSTVTRVTTDIGQVHAVLLRDVSEQQQILDRLSHETKHDRLTGLRSRESFVNKLKQLLDRGATGVLIVDIDNFKTVNNVGGEWGGDQVLKILADRLHNALGQDYLLARIGGDEFAIAVQPDNGLTLSELDNIAETIHPIVNAAVRISEQVVELTASIGFAVGNNIDAQELIGDAMAAKVAAKRRGGNGGVGYDDDLALVIAQRRRVEGELKLALANDKLELWLQPVTTMHDQRICGAEALVRWPQEDGSMIFPDAFIPIAEESSLIIELDKWVIDKACETLAGWGPVARDLHVAVNVSARHLTEGDLVSAVLDSCRRWSLDPSRLGIEITESLLVVDKEACQFVITRLRDLGVTLLIDDFGTGYSSLAYLQDLQFDVLKIDRAFVSRCNDDEKSEAIVKAMVGLGHTMGLRVHAEGVETLDQRSLLAGLGCEYEQGYLFSPPRPTDEFIDIFNGQLLANNHLQQLHP